MVGSVATFGAVQSAMEKPIASHSEEMRTTATATATLTATSATSAVTVYYRATASCKTATVPSGLCALLTQRMIYPGRSPFDVASRNPGPMAAIQCTVHASF